MSPSIPKLASGTYFCVVCLFATEVQADADMRKLLDKKPTREWLAKLEKVYSASETISVKYTNLQDVEAVYFSKEVADTNWRYSFVKRCPNGCASEAVDLRRILTSGLRISGDCPPPFSMVIDFQAKNDEILGKIFVNGTGQCFSIDMQGYFVNDANSLYRLVRQPSGPLVDRE